jgi:hypothetical protein
MGVRSIIEAVLKLSVLSRLNRSFSQVGVMAKPENRL